MTGTFDPAFGRNKRLVHLLGLEGHQVRMVREEVWGDDLLTRASQKRLRTVLRLLFAYPRLVIRLLRAPRVDAYLVGYPGWFDVPAVALVGWLRRVPVVFDPFVGLYETLVTDRQLSSPSSLYGRIARIVDKVACRMATVVLADTPLHADFLSEQTGVGRDRFRVLWVGAQDDTFAPRRGVEHETDTVLFYGTMIPLQAPEVILRAALRLTPHGVRVLMVGDGQLRPRVDALVAELALSNVELHGSVPIERLPGLIARATVVLGIFGGSSKAQRVVPHKVFEAAAVGSAIVTADTLAVRMAFRAVDLALVPPDDPDALAAEILDLIADPERRDELAHNARETYAARYHERHLAPLLTGHLSAAVLRKRR